jgi:hypothetical protein
MRILATCVPQEVLFNIAAVERQVRHPGVSQPRCIRVSRANTYTPITLSMLSMHVKRRRVSHGLYPTRSLSHSQCSPSRMSGIPGISKSAIGVLLASVVSLCVYRFLQRAAFRLHVHTCTRVAVPNPESRRKRKNAVGLGVASPCACVRVRVRVRTCNHSRRYLRDVNRKVNCDQHTRAGGRWAVRVLPRFVRRRRVLNFTGPCLLCLFFHRRCDVLM